MTDRDAFLSIVPNLPLLPGDVIAVLCGEDCEPRLQVAKQMFAGGGGASVLLLGGRDEPPAVMGAERAAPMLMGMGVAPDRVKIETASQNTREQAVALVAAALDAKWRRVPVVASPYHIPRAMLTLVKALVEADAADKVQFVPVAASQAPWWGEPEGRGILRADLLALELDKIELYQLRGDCASYADGLAYLRAWESK